MNDMVKNSVESRKTALFTSYEITDEKLKKKIDDYFERLEKFASNYSDPMEFETAFAQDKLCKEYSDLFTAAMSQGEKKPSAVKEAAKDAAWEIKNDVKYHVRHKAYVETSSKVRSIPVVGDVIQAKQTFDLFKRFRKPKVEEQPEVEEQNNEE